jgi:hypothetical protein
MDAEAIGELLQDAESVGVTTVGGYARMDG